MEDENTRQQGAINFNTYMLVISLEQHPVTQKYTMPCCEDKLKAYRIFHTNSKAFVYMYFTLAQPEISATVFALKLDLYISRCLYLHSLPECRVLTLTTYIVVPGG